MSIESDERPPPSPNDIRSSAFRSAFDAVPTGIVIVDGSGGIVAVNSAAERMFLYQQSQLGGQRINVLVPPGSRSGHSDRVAVFLKTPASRAMGAGSELSSPPRWA